MFSLRVSVLQKLPAAVARYSMTSIAVNRTQIEIYTERFSFVKPWVARGGRHIAVDISKLSSGIRRKVDIIQTVTVGGGTESRSG
jgi:hypothetical protein